MKRRRANQFLTAIAVICLTIPTATGCGLFVNLYHAWQGGELVPARFEGLRGKRVAVVCVSQSKTFGPTSIPEVLARQASLRLAREVKDIDVIHQNEIADWIDTNNWDQIKYRDVGRGVNADIVVAIDLQYAQVEGSMIYRGRANYTVKVFDMESDGDLVYERREPEFTFPTSGQHSTGTTESRFRRVFVEVLSQEIANDFYPYPLLEEFGQAAKFQ